VIRKVPKAANAAAPKGYKEKPKAAATAATAANAKAPKAYKYKLRYITYTTAKASSYMLNKHNTPNQHNTPQRLNKDIDLSFLKYIKSTNKNDIDINEATQFICNELDGISIDVVKNRLEDIKQYQAELKVLLQLPLMKQRTTEWFDARKTRLTASDLYDAIKVTSGGSDTSVSIKLAKKKANIVAADTINYNAIPALKWGTMFEPMATRCYSQKMNDITIHDFGLICDTENEHFGASPDGINELGIMLEIKCPYSRKIVDGVIPDKYKMQIQGQLAVCKLKECDYIECIFKSLETVDEYLCIEGTAAHGTACARHGTAHGVIAEFYNRAGEYVYYYSEPDRTPAECLEDIRIIAEGIMSGGDKLKFSKYTYWRLDEMIIQRVVFNASEWLTIIPKINTFWEKVEEYKLLPIEMGIKKYAFVDDDADATTTGTKYKFVDDTEANATAKGTTKTKYKFVEDDDEDA
jgi:putative phage-type endonuclease